MQRIGIFLLALIAVGGAGLYWIGGFSDDAARNRSQTYSPEATSSPSADTDRSDTNAASGPPASLTLATTSVSLPDGGTQTFQLSDAFTATVAASGLGKARFMAMSPDGRLFVPDLVDYKLSREGKLFALDDFDAEQGVFRRQQTYLSGLRGPNSVAFYTDANGQTWLYLALTEHLLRYPYAADSSEPSGDPEVVITFPNKQAESANSVVWHITRTIDFHNGRLYVSVGSGCNACEETDYRRAALYSMTPEGEDVRVEARGLRNAVGFDWAAGELYATENGADHLGPEAPDDLVYRMTRGDHYGWPYCYESDGEVVPDTSRTWSRDFDCSTAPVSLAALEPHAAPLGITYFEAFSQPLTDTFLVAQHGSFEPSVGTEPKVLRMTTSGNLTTFMRGFENAAGERTLRPVDFLPHDRQSFFMTDDQGGRVYYITTHQDTQ